MNLEPQEWEANCRPWNCRFLVLKNETHGFQDSASSGSDPESEHLQTSPLSFFLTGEVI